MMTNRDGMRGRVGKADAGQLESGGRPSSRRSAAWMTRLLLASLLPGLAAATGCVTKGDFLRLEEKVADYHRPGKESPDPFSRIAQLSSDVDALRQEVRDLQGQLELARKESSEALSQASLARTAAVQVSPGGSDAPGSQPETSGGGDAAVVPGAVAGSTDSAAAPARDDELQGYQQALDAWRQDDFDVCIERFTAFLQKHPASGYADDAAYWLADCTYKKGEYKRAVVRFNAVVSVYPESPKAPDALYRQGESLLKLGPKFHEAARTVFRRVQSDYPDSERARESAEQLERLGPGSAAG